jgi:UDP-2,4-diacetamido-2,4,6-trideoxy-beta-L-altropyranose hydrolase
MRLVFRPELSPEIGTGHLMRCWALAQTCLAQGCEALFALHRCPESLRARVTQPGISTTALAQASDTDELAAAAARFHAQAVVLDGYGIDSGYRRAVAMLGMPVLAVDDGNLSFPLHADIVLNSSPTARGEDYAVVAPAARLLLGPAFAPLRSEFLEPCALPERPGSGNRVLVTFGGSDPTGLTLPVSLALLERLPPEACLDIVVGAAHAEPAPLEQLAATWPARITLHRNSDRMAGLMAGSRLAVSAAGSTLWELASLAVPSVGVVVADNQADRLDVPARDWFLTLDARHDPQDAARRVADRALALWQDSDLSRTQSERLRSIGVGRRLPEVCAAIRDLIEDRT